MNMVAKLFEKFKKARNKKARNKTCHKRRQLVESKGQE